MPKEDQGVFNERYRVIPRCLIFPVENERVLLLKGAARKRLWANKFNGVGGHIEYGEDIHSAARRELFEETGFIAGQLVLCGVVMVDASCETGICLFIYKSEMNKGHLIESKEGTLEWIDYSRIGELPLVEDLPIILPKVIEFKLGDLPFAAHSFYDENEQLHIKIFE